MTLLTNLLAVILTKTFTYILWTCVHRRRDLINNLLRRLNLARDFLGRVSYCAYRCSVVNRTILSRRQKSLSMCVKEGGKEKTDETSLRLSSFSFLWSIVLRHQLFAIGTWGSDRRPMYDRNNSYIDISGKIRHTLAGNL